MTSYKYVRSMEFNILAVKHSLIRDIPRFQHDPRGHHLVQIFPEPVLHKLQTHHIRYQPMHLAYHDDLACSVNQHEAE